MTSYNKLIVVDKEYLESVIQKELTRVKNGDYQSYRFNSILKELKHTDFNEDEVSVKFITSEWLVHHPFNSWACGMDFQNIDFLSDNIKIEDLMYALAVTRGRNCNKGLECSPHEDTILTLNFEKGLYFKGVWVNFVDPSKMNHQERSELFDNIYNLCF